MIAQELGTTWTAAGLVVLSSIAMYCSLVVYTRVAGLRTFSKMSSFDFAITVAFGSMLASVALSGSSLLEGIVALGVLIGMQVLVALARRHGRFSRVVDNQPVLLMAGPRLLERNLDRTRVTADDIRSQLRQHNVLNHDSLRAVVLETTGDISVLHGDGPLDLEVVADVRDQHELRAADAPPA